MIFLLDNLTAVIIAGVLGMVLFTTHVRVQSLNIEVQTQYAMRRLSADMATWMEDDILEIGRNMPAADVPFENPVDSAGFTKTFTFFRDSVTVDAATGVSATLRIATQYRLEKTGTRTATDGTAFPIYRVDRYVREGAAGTWKFDGSAPPLLTHFTISMLNTNAEAISSPADTFAVDPNAIRNTGIRFSMATPHEQVGVALQSVHFASTLMIPYKKK